MILQLSEYSTLFENIKPTFNEKSLSALKPHSHPEDKLILEEIAIIEAVAEKITELNELPSLVVLRVSITPLISAHSAASPSVTEALKKLSSAIEKLSAAVEETSNGDVLFTVVATKETLARKKRQAVVSFLLFFCLNKSKIIKFKIKFFRKKQIP